MLAWESKAPKDSNVEFTMNGSVMLPRHPFGLEMASDDNRKAKTITVSNHSAMLVWMRESLDKGRRIGYLRTLEPGGAEIDVSQIGFFEIMIGDESMMCVVKGHERLNMFSMFLDLAHRTGRSMQRIELSVSDISKAQKTINRKAN